MRQISVLPVSTRHVNANWVPSGDQAGSETDRGLSVMSVAAEPPAALITHSPGRPLRELVNAIFVPSGDQAG